MSEAAAEAGSAIFCWRCRRPLVSWRVRRVTFRMRPMRHTLRMCRAVGRARVPCVHASHVSSSGTAGSTAGSSSSAGSGTAVSTTVFKATLTMGQVKPKPRRTKAGAAGHFHATLVGTTLKWTLTHTHLSGAARSAALHGGRRGTNGPTLARLCASCASFETGAVVLTQAEVNDLLAGRAYVEIITAKNPKGEVRGQITRG